MSWLKGKYSISHVSCVLLLIIVPLAIYFPGLSGGIHSVDDPGIIDFYSSAPPLMNLLLPNSTSYYYRPVVELSFYCDNLLWGMNSWMMHQENLMLHCVSSLLVFFLICKIAGMDNQFRLWMALIPALWFAVHPVHVEAVAWIAGRTDLLLAAFLLSSLYVLLNWIETPTKGRLVASVGLFYLALLAKETAFVFILVVLALVLTVDGAASVKQRRLLFGAMSAPALLLLIMVIFFKHEGSSFARLFVSTQLEPAQVVSKLLAALGYYERKLLFAAPLNFSIMSVPPAYVWCGIASLPGLWLTARWNRMASILLASGLLMLLPPLLLVIKPISWTPVAERYLYVPIAFCAVGLATLMGSCGKSVQRLFMTLLLAFVCLYAMLSYHRVLLWNDKEAFFQDAIAKSPGNGSLYNDLGRIYLQRNDFAKAAAAFASADRLNTRESMRIPIKANMMLVALSRKQHEEVRMMFFNFFRNKKDAPADVLEILYKADGRRLASLAVEEQQSLAADIIETLDILYRKRPDPFFLYRSGQLALVRGENERAAGYFRRAYREAPADAHYRNAARTYIQRLERNQ